MEITGSYNLILVALSFVVSVFGSYTALRISRQIGRAEAGSDRALWLGLAAFAMGGGAIWSMHFIGMVAFDLGIRVSYDVPFTLLSLAIAVGATGFGFLAVGHAADRPTRLAGAGTMMGLGIAGMHYTGMYAMRMSASQSYGAALVLASIAIAVAASTAALWLAFNLDQTWQTVGGAVVMGVAVCGMHYTAMAAASFTRGGRTVELGAAVVSPNALAYGVFLMSMLILSIGLAFEVGQRALREEQTPSQIGDF